MTHTWINRILVVLGAVGLFISGVLSYSHLTNALLPCGAASGCERLAALPESKWFGVPVAFYGFAGYLVLFVLAGLRTLAYPRFGAMATQAGLWISGIGFAGSLLLVYTLIGRLGIQCEWCFGSAITMTLTFVGHLLLKKVSAPQEEEVAMTDAALVPFMLVVALFGSYSIVDARPKLPPPVEIAESALKLDELVPHASYFDGPESARVTVVEIADFYCPACRTSKAIVDRVKQQYKGRIRFAYRSLPLFHLEGHENSLAASLGAEYARLNGKYWEFIDKMFTPGMESSVRTPEAVAEMLGGMGLNSREWLATYREPSSQMFKDLDQGLALFERMSLTSTPMFIVFLDNTRPYAVTAPQLEQMLAGAPFKEALEAK